MPPLKLKLKQLSANEKTTKEYCINNTPFAVFPVLAFGTFLSSIDIQLFCFNLSFVFCNATETESESIFTKQICPHFTHFVCTQLPHKPSNNLCPQYGQFTYVIIYSHLSFVFLCLYFII